MTDEQITKQFEVTKTLQSDIRDILQTAISLKYKELELDSYYDLYVLNVDESKKEVYFEIYHKGMWSTYMTTYELNVNETAATLSDSAYETTRKTYYEVIPIEVGKSLNLGDVVKEVVSEEAKEDNPLLVKVTNLIDKAFGGSNKNNDINESLSVIKQFEDEQMVAIEKLYINPLTEEADLVGDSITLEDTRGMVDSLNKAINSEKGIQSGLFHKANADDVFTVEKAWIAETDCTIGDTFIEEGQPLIKVQFHNKEAWELRKSGELQGISIGARAKQIEEI